MNLVWTPAEGTTLHAGYARYFSPPPFELVGTASVARFVCTSGAPPGLTCPQTTPIANDTPLSERSNYYDVGAQQKLDVVAEVAGVRTEQDGELGLGAKH